MAVAEVFKAHPENVQKRRRYRIHTQCFQTTLHSISLPQRHALAHGLLEVIHLVAHFCKHCDYIHAVAFMSKERHASYKRTVEIYCLVTRGHANAHTNTQSPRAPRSPMASCQLTGTQCRQLEGKLEDSVPEFLSNPNRELKQFNWDWFRDTSPLLRDGQQIQNRVPVLQHQDS